MNLSQRMIAQTKRIRRKTTLGQLELLLEERAKWQRRQTIASTKLDALDRQLRAVATQLAEDKFAAELANVSAE